MSELEIKWPDEMAEQIRVAKGRIHVSGSALRAMTLEERLGTIRLVLEDWTAADSPWRRELATTFGSDSPFDVKTVREGLDAALRAWKPEALIACARRELAPVLDSGTLALAPFAFTAVLAGGGLPMPTLLGGLLPLILGSPVLMREASGDRVTASLLKRSLDARSPEMAKAFEHCSFAKEDAAFAEMLDAPCVVATGSDETIRSIAARLQPHQRFVSYGHQFSIGVLGPELAKDEPALRRATTGYALDIARWDQTGCLSPVILYLVGLDPTSHHKIAASLAEALEELHLSMPRGPLSVHVAASHANEIAEAKMRQARDRGQLFEGSDSVVVLETGSEARPAPLHRFIRLMPVASIDALAESLSPFAGRLSTAALNGFSEAQSQRLRTALASMGVSRVTQPGRLQTPPIDWPHDGMPLLTPLARFTQSD
ncbi:MAG: acyl-CoA reductase [Myxococcota bacterium]